MTGLDLVGFHLQTQSLKPLRRYLKCGPAFKVLGALLVEPGAFASFVQASTADGAGCGKGAVWIE